MYFNFNARYIKSIKSKLTFILGVTAIVAVTLSSVSIFTLIIIKKTSIDKKNLEKLSNIMADNLSASVFFEDQSSANNTLHSLKSDSNIEGAFILLLNNEIFASYVSQKNRELNFQKNTIELLKQEKNDIKNAKSYIDFKKIIVSQPIYLDKRHIASLILVSNTKELYATLFNILTVLSVVFMLVVFVTYLISSKLQKIFTEPIFVLIERIQEIVKYSKYDKNITEIRNDEFQVLYDGFNTLLKTIDTQTKELQRLASIDPMTQLYNRRYLTDMTTHIMELTKRNKTNLSVVMIDIDHFKKINDTYGHKTGDEVIKLVASTLKNITRASDIVCRFGGEEFLILLPETAINGAINLTEKIRKTVERLEVVSNSEEKFRFTISCGVAEVSIDKDKDIEASIHRADQALYEAKESGRNTIIAKNIC